MPDTITALKCELAADVLRTSGTLTLGVTGWSMLPTVWPGDRVMIQRADSKEVFEGDIVLTRREKRFCVHRVLKKGWPGQSLVTRGDAMPAPDPPVLEGDVLGKIAVILRSGRCIQPSRKLRLSERAVAALVRRSRFAARVVVGVHGITSNK